MCKYGVIAFVIGLCVAILYRLLKVFYNMYSCDQTPNEYSDDAYSDYKITHKDYYE
jgi:hypothetical protein